MHSISKKYYRRSLVFGSIFITSLLLNGCVPVAVVGGMSACGYTTMRDKKVKDSINDTTIETEIKTKLYKISPELYSDISVNVESGHVLLTGSTSHKEWIHMCEEEARNTSGVVCVDNNIVEGKLSLSQIIKDGSITSNIRASIVCDKNIKSVNYKIKTMNGIVYLRGIARSEHELDSVIRYAQKTKDVKKVISYVKLLQ